MVPNHAGRCSGPTHADEMLYYSDTPQMYGAFGCAFPDPDGKVAAQAIARGPRKKMNIVAVALSLFVPWALFCVVFATMSFFVHYQRPQVAYILVGLAFVAVATMGLHALNAVKGRNQGGPLREPTWYVFMFATSLLAWVLAVSGGDINFFRNMQPLYDLLNLNVYPSVDPARMRGQQLMDAGRMVFTPGSHLDMRYSMGFKNLEMYCVAPITSGVHNNTSPRLASYDFWAVGLNCCSGSSPDFHCGEYNNPRAHAGLRLMRDELRPFFRLAVQQAEAAYNIRAVHPLFVYWMQDPVSEVHAYEADGFQFFLLGMFSHFSLQLFLVIAVALGFSKLGQA